MNLYSNSRMMFKTCIVVIVFLALASIVGESVQGAKKKPRQPFRSTSVSLTNPQGTTTRWKNQRGSTMVLIEDGHEKITGEYSSAVRCAANNPVKLFGTTNVSSISFTVNWTDCSSIP